MKRIATIDVGTNTALLLVADVAPGVLAPVREETRFVRLGEGVDRTRRVGLPAMERLRTVLLEYRQIASDLGAEDIVVAGTSASRDALNRQELIDFVRRETGLAYEIISGEEEAVWTFSGAVSAYRSLQGPCATLDIGGGSSEITIGEADGGGASVRFRQSFDVGAVRLTERFFSAQPPAPEEIGAAEQVVRGLLEKAAIRWPEGLPLIGVAGTVTSLALVDLGRSTWDGLGNDVSLDARTVRSWRKRLSRLAYEETLALNPPVMQGRADVFLAGILILDAVMSHFGISTCRVSPRDLRHGLALRHVAAG